MKSIARKLDLDLWLRAKREAIARMGGVFSARAMQLAVQIYKARGGRYAGSKTGREGLSKWTREQWQTRPGTSKKATRASTTARYLPKAAWAKLSASEQRATDEKKRRGCRGVRGPCFVPNTRVAKRAGVVARKGRASSASTVQIPVRQIAFAFPNPIDEDKLHRYRLRLARGSKPPRVRAYRRTIDEVDVERGIEFIDGREASVEDLGAPVYYLVDGYHRAIAALLEGRPTVAGVLVR